MLHAKSNPIPGTKRNGFVALNRGQCRRLSLVRLVAYQGSQSRSSPPLFAFTIMAWCATLPRHQVGYAVTRDSERCVQCLHPRTAEDFNPAGSTVSDQRCHDVGVLSLGASAQSRSTTPPRVNAHRAARRPPLVGVPAEHEAVARIAVRRGPSARRTPF